MSRKNHRAAISFVEDLVTAVPEFLAYRDEPIEWYQENITLTLADVGHWLKDLKDRGDEESLAIIKQICDCINEYVNKDYQNDDMQNNIQVSLFWLLDYDEIMFFKSFFSEDVLKLGREYLKNMDGSNYKPF